MSAAEVIRQELQTVRGFGTTATWAERVLNALKARGYAVVELPEPDFSQDGPRWRRDSDPSRPADARGGVATVAVMRDEVKAFISCLGSPEDARWAAAALLAAANAAEASA